MNRPLLLSIAVCAALASCKKSEPAAVNLTPAKETAAGVNLIDYDSPKGAFTCRAPADWKGREVVDGLTDTITFVGPWSAKGMANISILQYPHAKNDQWKDADKYAQSFWVLSSDGKQPPLEKKTIGDKTVTLLHFERPFRRVHSKKIEYMLREDVALIPVKGGFFEISHSAPVHMYQETLPIFEAVVRSFKPKI
jgi:hypothetical protein